MDWEVVWTDNGYHRAYFDNAIDSDAFAQLMANEGKLYSVKVAGLDITEQYVTIIRL